MSETHPDGRNWVLGQDLRDGGWYHSMELPGGRVIEGAAPLSELRERFASFGLPDDLTGRRVLDIGTWDGWFAFEAERRGAEVVAIDRVEQENFRYAHREIGSKIRYIISDVYDIPRLGLGQFDYTLFLGVMYHLRHPLLALDIVCGLTKEAAIVDSLVLPGNPTHADSAAPWLEFYESDELASRVDNWFGPTLECLMAFCRSAGFPRVALRDLRHHHAALECRRRWEPVLEQPLAAPPVLTAAVNAENYGINFDNTRLEEFLTCWIRVEQESVAREDLRPEIGGYGVPVLALSRAADGAYVFSCRLPPGLEAGWHDVRVRTRHSDFGAACRIAVGLPLGGAPRIHGLSDGLTWRKNEILLPNGGGGYLTAWVGGLPENSDRNSVRIFLGGHRLRIENIAAPKGGIRQVNAKVPASVEAGRFPVVIASGGSVSAEETVSVVRRLTPPAENG